ncbi:MAG: hypothetical protein AAF657_05435 [Acidobacteriota bacterium]
MCQDLMNQDLMYQHLIHQDLRPDGRFVACRSRNRLRWILALICGLGFVVWPAAGQAGEPYHYVDTTDRVVVGATELLASPGVAAGVWPSGDRATFYNTTALKVGNQYAIWAQTGWDGGGCPSGAVGLDQVIVFTSSQPDTGFLPRACNGNCGGPISRAQLVASIATDTQVDNQCDAGAEPWMWGLGDVIHYAGSSYLATLDLTQQGLSLYDWGKFELYLARSDGLDLTSQPYLFARTVDDGDPATELLRIVNPVPFRIDSNTVGVIFRFFGREDESVPPHLSVLTTDAIGYMTLDFTSFPSSFTVRILDENGVYRTLQGPDYEFAFRPMNLNAGFHHSVFREVNRVLNVDGEWVAFYSELSSVDPGNCPTIGQGSRLGYRSFAVNGSLWDGWLGVEREIHQTVGSPPRAEVVNWDGFWGVQAPSPLVEADGTVHYYFTKDNQCQDGAAASGFNYLDINHAELETYGGNLVANGNWESDTLQLPFTSAFKGNLSVVDNQAATGVRSLRHVANGNDSRTKPWVNTPSAIVTEVVGEQDFRFSVSAKANQSASTQVYLFCLDQNLKWQTFGSSSGHFTATPAWQRLEHSHSCPAGTRYLSVRLDNNQSGRTVWWDDARVAEDNLLADGSFESGQLLLPFRTAARGSLSPDTTVAHWGSTSLRHEATGGDSYTLPWQKDTGALIAAAEGPQTFRFSAWALADEPSASIQLFIFCLDDELKWQQYGASSGTFSAGLNWPNEPFEHTHTCPAGTRYVSVRLDNNTAGTTVWWDDLVLRAVD